jgi:hypothetical protein
MTMDMTVTGLHWLTKFKKIYGAEKSDNEMCRQHHDFEIQIAWWKGLGADSTYQRRSCHVALP